MKFINLREVKGDFREKVELYLLDDTVSEFWKTFGANVQYDASFIPVIKDIWTRYTVGVFLA